jgi:hypothetical protein
MTFDEWLDSIIPRDDHTWREAMDEEQINAAHNAWNACNRAAREECAAICDKIAESYENTGQEWMTGVHSAKRCERAIMETISGQT